MPGTTSQDHSEVVSLPAFVSWRSAVFSNGSKPGYRPLDMRLQRHLPVCLHAKTDVCGACLVEKEGVQVGQCGVSICSLALLRRLEQRTFVHAEAGLSLIRAMLASPAPLASYLYSEITLGCYCAGGCVCKYDFCKSDLTRDSTQSCAASAASFCLTSRTGAPGGWKSTFCFDAIKCVFQQAHVIPYSTVRHWCFLFSFLAPKTLVSSQLLV